MKLARPKWPVRWNVAAAVAVVACLHGADARTAAQQAASTTAFVDAGGGVRLETVAWGERGEPVILLPGSGYSVTAFGLLAPELARRGYRLIAVNPRGVGGSDGPLDGLTYHDYAADVAAVVDRMAGGRAHIVGWAWGNRIARCLATDAPGRVATVTLIAAGGKVPPDPIAAAAAKQLAGGDVSAEERSRLYASRMLAPGSPVAPLLAITESWPRGQAAQAAAGRATPLGEWWAGGSAPMLVVQGLQDKVAPPGNGRDLKATYPERVTLIEIDGAGHAVLVEHPARLAEDIAAFLRRHPLRSGR
jgi:pimeloyl-ACP methyl ester carboxylesterase